MDSRAWCHQESFQYQVITNDQSLFGHTKLIYLRVDKCKKRVLASLLSSPGGTDAKCSQNDFNCLSVPYLDDFGRLWNHYNRTRSHSMRA